MITIECNEKYKNNILSFAKKILNRDEISDEALQRFVKCINEEVRPGGIYALIKHYGLGDSSVIIDGITEEQCLELECEAIRILKHPTRRKSILGE